VCAEERRKSRNENSSQKSTPIHKGTSVLSAATLNTYLVEYSGLPLIYVYFSGTSSEGKPKKQERHQK